MLGSGQGVAQDEGCAAIAPPLGGGTLAGGRFHNVDLTGSRFTGVIVDDVEIDGLVRGLIVNGVDVVPLMQAELDRIHPELPLIRSGEAHDLREGWSIVRSHWDATLALAADLPEVDDEWCLADTLRHLVFVTDAWLRRPVLGEPHPYWAGGLGATDTPQWFHEAADLDRSTVPAIGEVRAARAARTAILSDVLAGLTTEELERRCRRSRTPRYPSDTSRYTVGECVRTVLSEEWAHHSFAARDLATLAAGPVE